MAKQDYLLARNGKLRIEISFFVHNLQTKASTGARIQSKLYR